MLHDKVFGVGFMAAAASMFGYSYMQKEKAFEELNQTFFRMKNEWEESKEKMINSLFSQEVKIKDMEEERKTRDLKILKTEEKIKEMEQEREQERREWEDHRLQLIREKEELSRRFLYADYDVMNRTPIKKNEREDHTFQLIRQTDALSKKVLSIEENEHMNQTPIKTEREDDGLQLTTEMDALSQAFLSAEKDEDEIRESDALPEMFPPAERDEDEIRETDAPSQASLSAENGEDEIIETDALSQASLSTGKDEVEIRQTDALSQKSLSAEKDEDEIRVTDALSQTFLSVENDDDAMKTTEKLVQIMEEMEDIQENKIPIQMNELEEEVKDKLLENVLLLGEKNEGVEDGMKTRGLLTVEEKIKYMAEELREEKKWEEKKREGILQLIGERQSSLSFLSAEQESEDMTNKMKTTRQEVLEMEEIEDIQKWTNQFSHVCELTLDIDTANRYLSLSENNRKVTRKVTKMTPVKEIKLYRSDNSERFDYWQQVMCREGLTERCYCVVEWGGKVSIAMTYKGIKRTGWHDDGLFGNNDKSWSLECTLGRYTVCHNKKKTVLAVRPSGSNRIGMYLDYRAGILTFYRVSDTHTILYTFLYTFTEPLYPGFWLGNDSYVALLDRENDLQTSSRALVARSASPPSSLNSGH